MNRKREREVLGGAATTGKSGESCETVLHKHHKDSQEGQHEIVSAGDVGGSYRHRFPISCCPVRGAPKDVFVISPSAFSHHGKDSSEAEGKGTAACLW